MSEEVVAKEEVEEVVVVEEEEEEMSVKISDKTTMTLEEAQEKLKDATSLLDAQRIVNEHDKHEKAKSRQKIFAQTVAEKEEVVKQANVYITKAFKKIDNAVKGFIEAEKILIELDSYIKENQRRASGVNRHSLVSKYIKERFPKRQEDRAVVTKALYGQLKYHRARFRKLKQNP